MNKTILRAQQTTHFHPALGPLYKLTFTDNTTALVYAETFFDQIKDWEPRDPLVGKSINLKYAFLYEEPLVYGDESPDEVLRMRRSVGI